MNFSTILGLATGLAVLYFGVLAHSEKPAMFLDSHALILVIGGTLAAGLIAFPIKKFKELGSFIMMGVLYPAKKAKLKVAREIIHLAGSTSDAQNVSDEVARFHPFLVEGYKLMRRHRLTRPELKQVLIQRSYSFKDRYASDAKTLNALAKFPPAFGLLGATTGMISMMTGLGSSGQDSIGPAMAIALVATFWGIAFANFILLPLADHASKLAGDDAHIREMIIVGVILIAEGKRPGIILEHLIGYLPVHERNDYELVSSVRENDQRFAVANQPLHVVSQSRSSGKVRRAGNE